MSELAPCPFCGEPPFKAWEDYVECNCGALGPDTGKGLEDSVAAAWNTRRASPISEELVAKANKAAALTANPRNAVERFYNEVICDLLAELEQSK